MSLPTVLLETGIGVASRSGFDLPRVERNRVHFHKGHARIVAQPLNQANFFAEAGTRLYNRVGLSHPAESRGASG